MKLGAIKMLVLKRTFWSQTVVRLTAFNPKLCLRTWNSDNFSFYLTSQTSFIDVELTATASTKFTTWLEKSVALASFNWLSSISSVCRESPRSIATGSDTALGCENPRIDGYKSVDQSLN